VARLARLTLPGELHFVVQRGHNGQRIFSGADDRQFMWDLLLDGASRFDVAIHGYVLLEGYFQLLATPATEKGLPLLLQAVGRRYVQYFNHRNQRTGTLWDGRYRSTLIQPDQYLFAALSHMDLAPVRSGVVSQPGEYAWSSHGHFVGLRVDKLVTAHLLIWGLGNTPFAREAAYARRIDEEAGLNASRLLDATHKGWALGDRAYMDDIQSRTGRRISRTNPGRPSKSSRSA
jgi:putative transposase